MPSNLLRNLPSIARYQDLRMFLRSRGELHVSSGRGKGQRAEFFVWSIPSISAHCFSPLTPRSSPLAPRPSLLAPRPSLLKKRLLGRDDRNPSSLWGKDQLPAEGAVVEAGLDSICLYQILDNN